MLSAGGLRRRLNLELALRLSLAPAWTAAGGLAAWRLAAGFAMLPATAALAAAASVATLLRLRRRAWTERDAAVMLDRLAGAGGLVLALREAPSAEWSSTLEARLAAAEAPRLQIARPLAALFGALGLAAAAVLLPAARSEVPPVQAAALAQVERAALQAEALAAEGALDETLRRELERLRAEAGQGRFDGSDWAALDALGEAIGQGSAERDAQLAAAARAAGQLSEALAAGGGEESERRAREALERALTALADGASGRSGEPQARREAAGVGAAGARPAGAAKARELAQALERRRRALGSGSGTGGTRSGAAQCQGGKGAQALECQGGQGGQGGGDGGDGEGERASESGTGSGGVSRGPGAAPVTFGAPHDVDPDGLQAVGIESHDEGDRGELTGILGVEPEPGRAADPASPGAAAGADGIRAREAPLAPRHRDVVKRYFDSNPRQKR